jgi:hypothetical protein
MRLNFEMTPAQMDSLKALQTRTGASSMKDLVNNAISILEWAADETAKGNDVASISEDDESYRVMVTPLLQYVAKNERRLVTAVGS